MARTDLVRISDRSTPRFSQDSAADPVQLGQNQGALDAQNAYVAAHPELRDPYHIPWWEPLLPLALVATGGAAGLGGFGGFGAGTAAGAGASAAAAGASLPVGGAGGAGLLAGTPGVTAASLFGPGAAAGGAAAGGTAAGTGGGWLSTLGQVAGVPSGTGAGGWINAAVDRIPQIAALARGAQGLESGRAAGRVAETNAANQYDYLDLARTRTMYDRAQMELDQRKFAQDLQERSAKQAFRGQLLQTARPGPVVTPPAEIAPFMGQSTGRSLGDIPQSTRDELGGAMYRNSITELLDPLQPGTATSGRRMAGLPEPNPLSPRPEANAFDTALNYTNVVGTMLPGIVDLIRGPRRPPTPSTGVTPGIDLRGGPNPFAGGATPPRSSTNPFGTGGQLPRISSPGGTPPSVVQPNVGMFSGQGRTGFGIGNPSLFAPPPPTPYDDDPMRMRRLG